MRSFASAIALSHLHLPNREYPSASSKTCLQVERSAPPRSLPSFAGLKIGRKVELGTMLPFGPSWFIRTSSGCGIHWYYQKQSVQVAAKTIGATVLFDAFASESPSSLAGSCRLKHDADHSSRRLNGTPASQSSSNATSATAPASVRVVSNAKHGRPQAIAYITATAL